MERNPISGFAERVARLTEEAYHSGPLARMASEPDEVAGTIARIIGRSRPAARDAVTGSAHLMMAMRRSTDTRCHDGAAWARQGRKAQGGEESPMSAQDFYKQLRDKVAGYTGPYAEYVLLAPDLFVLVSKLMLDKRVDSRHKLYLGAALAYVLSPIDLLSERTFGVAGYLDDVAVVAAALNMVLNEVDTQIVAEHWTGKADLLEQVQKIAAQADQLVGKGRLDTILDQLGLRKAASRPAASA